MTARRVVIALLTRLRLDQAIAAVAGTFGWHVRESRWLETFESTLYQTLAGAADIGWSRNAPVLEKHVLCTMYLMQICVLYLD